MKLKEYLEVTMLGEPVDLEVGDQEQLLVGQGGHLLEAALRCAADSDTSAELSHEVLELGRSQLKQLPTLREKELAG